MAIADYTPTAKELGQFMHARSANEWGDETGEFNKETRPTAEEADSLIKDAVNDVYAAVGALDAEDSSLPCVTRSIAAAKSAVKIYAAMLIELGYQPEQSSTKFSPFDNLEKLYERKMKVLVEAVSECPGLGGGGGESVGGSRPLARGAFCGPAPVGGRAF